MNMKLILVAAVLCLTGCPKPPPPAKLPPLWPAQDKAVDSKPTPPAAPPPVVVPPPVG